MRLAIVALNAYPAIVPKAGNTVGGLETVAWSMARTLARDPALKIQFLVRRTRRPPQPEVDGVELLCEVEPLRPVRQAVSRDVEVMTQVPWLRIKRFRPGLLWQVPLLHVYGDADEVVPWDENTGLIAERDKALGGDITLIAKPGVKHHLHGLEDSTPIVEFIERHRLLK